MASSCVFDRKVFSIISRKPDVYLGPTKTLKFQCNENTESPENSRGGIIDNCTFNW